MKQILSRKEFVTVYKHMEAMPGNLIAGVTAEAGAKMVEEATGIKMTHSIFGKIRRELGVIPVREQRKKENKERANNRSNVFTRILAEFSGIKESIAKLEQTQQNILTEIAKFNP